MVKKLASFILFLSLTSLFFLAFLKPGNANIANTTPDNDPVAQTGLNLKNDLPVKPVKPTFIPPTFQPTVQAVQSTSFLRAVQPTEISTSIATQDAIYEESGEFERLVAQVVDGEAGVLRGVFVEGVLALPVIQQPKSDELFVSSQRGIATQFQNAANHGITGLLAHNFLSGELFYELRPGQPVLLIYGDGKITRYIIKGSHRYQKLEPNNPRSRYIELSTGDEKSTDQIFNQFYTGKDHLVFQTCLRNGAEWSWGLEFTTAVPAELR